MFIPGQNGFVPVVEMKAAVNGLESVLYHDFRLEHWQFMPMKRAFMDVLRADQRISAVMFDAMQAIEIKMRKLERALEESEEYMEKKEYKEKMEASQYFTFNALVRVYPMLSYLKNADVKVGEYCCMFGNKEVSNYVVKVGEAVYDREDGNDVWREGIYRISNIKPPELTEG